MSNPDFVAAVLSDSVRVQCESAEIEKELCALRAKLSSQPHCWEIPYESKKELAAVLTKLAALGVPFLDEPAGWPPAAVFQALWEEGLTSGVVKKISWRGPDDFYTF